MSEQSMIIPIDLQTLVVPVENKMKKLNLGSRFNESVILGIDQQYNLDNLFEPEKKEPITKGIHLHWRLPKLLRHGLSNEKDEMQFPAAPNRWMVVRYQTNIDNPKAIPAKAWLIKSDAKLPNKLANWVVTNEVYGAEKNGYLTSSQSYGFQAIGSAEVWNNTYEDQATDKIALTAVGAANPYFSFIYDESVDVFGFCDTMEGTAFGDTFTYVITGWYSDPKNDPLHPDPKTEVNPELLARIQKTWQTKTTDTTAERCIFSTTVHSVSWQENIGSGISNAEVGVVLGNNSTECLSRLIVEQNKERLMGEEMEDSLNALQNYLLENDRELPDRLTIQEANFKRQFVPRDRGIYWELKKIEEEKELQSEQTKPYFPQDRELVEIVKTLNNYQMTYNNIRQQLLSLQQTFYFEWYKKVLIQTQADQIKDFNPNWNEALDANMAKIKGEIETKRKNLEEVQKQINGQIAIIDQSPLVFFPRREEKNGAAYEKKNGAAYELIKSTEENYFEPNDPALLLYGEGLGNMSGFNQEVRDSIKCRHDNEIQKDLAINDIKWVSKDIFAFTGITINHEAIPSQTIEDLLYEACLFDPQLAAFIAIKMEGTGREKESEVIQKWVDEKIKPVQKELLTPLEDYAFQKYIQAWQPLFLLWEADYIPQDNAQSTNTCRGLIPVTNGVSKNIRELVSEDTKEKYQQVIAQNLSGLHRQLVTQSQVLQLPPLEYKMVDGDLETDMQIDTVVSEVIDINSNAYQLACNPFQPLFSPLRKGYLKINKLSLVDGFGQEKTVIDKAEKQILLPKSVASDHKATVSSNEEILLGERIIQPTRIAFEWVNEAKERLYQDTGKMDHPIVGWLVPNYLDNMLMVYDEKGHELKGLRLTDGNKNFEEYYPENEGTLSVADIAAERKEKMPAVIQHLLEGLNVEKFMNTTRETRKKIAASKAQTDFSAVSLLYGNPIAIATARLGLELLGNAYQNQQWAAIDTPNAGGIEEQEIAIKIGNPASKEDGLIGFYLRGDYTTLYDSQTPIKLKIGGEPLTITVLLTAGTSFCIDAHPFLPTKQVQLFPHAVEELTQDINISFMLSPFLTNKNRQSVPVPMSQNSWMWVHKTDVNVWEPPKALAASGNEENYDLSGSQLYEGWAKMTLFNPPKPKVS